MNFKQGDLVVAKEFCDYDDAKIYPSNIGTIKEVYESVPYAVICFEKPVYDNCTVWSCLLRYFERYNTNGKTKKYR